MNPSPSVAVYTAATSKSYHQSHTVRETHETDFKYTTLLHSTIGAPKKNIHSKSTTISFDFVWTFFFPSCKQNFWFYPVHRPTDQVLNRDRHRHPPCYHNISPFDRRTLKKLISSDLKIFIIAYFFFFSTTNFTFVFGFERWCVCLCEVLTWNPPGTNQQILPRKASKS